MRPVSPDGTLVGLPVGVGEEEILAAVDGDSDVVQGIRGGQTLVARPWWLFSGSAGVHSGGLGSIASTI